MLCSVTEVGEKIPGLLAHPAPTTASEIDTDMMPFETWYFQLPISGEIYRRIRCSRKYKKVLYISMI